MARSFAAVLFIFVWTVLAQERRPGASSVSGHIVPQFTGLSIGLARYTYDGDGNIKLIGIQKTKTTNAIGKFGEYRFDDVAPGEYYVFVDPNGLFRSPTKGEAFPTLYYPGGVDFSTASRILVKAGEDVQLNDMSMISVPAPSVRINLVNATGDSDLSGRCATLSWKLRGVPDSGSGEMSMKRCFIGESLINPIGALAPGTYDLYAGWAANTTGATMEGAVVSFEVRSMDLDVEVVVSRARLSGKILLEEADGTVRPAAGLRLNFKPATLGPAEWVETAADGSFLRERVGRNLYLVEALDLPPNAYLAGLRQDDRDVLRDGLDVRTTDIELQGLLSIAGAQLDGTVTDSNNRRVSHATVVLIPDVPRANHRYRTTVTDDIGAFVLRAIPPGSYRLFAWPGLNGAAFKNAEFMKAYEARGTPAVLERNGHLTIEAKLVD